MKIKDVTAPYPRMAMATALFLTNIPISYSKFPVRIVLDGIAKFPHLSNLSKVSKVIGVNNTKEKKTRLTIVIRRQASSPDIMSLKNPNVGLVRMSHKRTIKPAEYIKPMMRNKHWKWSGSIIIGLWLRKERGSLSSYQQNSRHCPVF